MTESPPASPSIFLRPRTPRQWAYRLLEEHRTTGVWVQDLLHATYAAGHVPPINRPFVTELVCGVVRRRATLDALLQHALTRPLASLEPELHTLLALGGYQLALLDDVPTFAAVHETVELTKWLGQRRWTGFANGVLRGVSRLVTSETAAAPARDAVPLGPQRFRRLTAPVFPDPATAPAAFVAAAYSLPEWLAARWAQRLAWDDLLAVATACNTAPVLYVRVNLLRTTRDELRERWAAAGVAADVCDAPEGLRLNSAATIEDLPGFQEGLFTPQDAVAMQAARRLAPQPGQRVWDVCAAPGTKTTHLAELMHDQGRLVATDIQADRLNRIDENCRRLGLTCVQTEFIPPDGSRLPDGRFDAILLDAPCSNTGVLHRRPEARWRLRPEDLVELPLLQARLLRTALERLRPNARLLYATCSIEPEENEHVVAAVLRDRPELALVESAAFLPGERGDGGYQALLVHRG